MLLYLFIYFPDTFIIITFITQSLIITVASFMCAFDHFIYILKAPCYGCYIYNIIYDH